MIKLERTSVFNFENAIRGMRNPMDSWDKSDSKYIVCADKDSCTECPGSGHRDICYLMQNGGYLILGKKDLKLATSLAHNSSDHRKFLRQIMVSVDITAPLYWWKEFDTYKVGTVANSCSTMHTIHKKRFTLNDFSCENLEDVWLESLKETIRLLNLARDGYIESSAEIKPLVLPKDYWWQMIQLLPSSYNQMRTVTLNYEVLLNQYHARNQHKLLEWLDYCEWVESLPYFKEICL